MNKLNFGEAKTEKSKEQVVKDMLKDESGNFVNTLNRVYYRKLPVTKIIFDKKNKHFQLWLDLSNYSSDVAKEINLDVLWDSMHVIKKCNHMLKIYKTGLLRPYVSNFKIVSDNITDENIETIKSFCLTMGIHIPLQKRTSKVYVHMRTIKKYE